MDKVKTKSGHRNWMLLLIFAAAVLLLGAGYWLYQKSIGQAAYSTTVSFMEQIADHDQMNIVNQLNSKWEYLESILERIRMTRNSDIEEVLYNLGVESRATSFVQLNLVTDQDKVLNSAYLESALENAPWYEAYRQAEGNFAVRYSESSRERWGDYLVYGIRLKESITCEGVNISGVVGLVPISEIASQMRMDSFDGRGMAIVMLPTGEIITASQNYSTPDQNYLYPLKNASFRNGGSYDACRQAIENKEKLFTSYSWKGKSYYVLFQPMNHGSNNGWYLVVQVSTDVTAEQVSTLIVRSIPFFLIMGVMILIITYFVYKSLNSAKIARASEQAKSAFLANMSHEIRTPLNGIVGLHYLMRSSLDDREKLEGYLKKAEISAEFLKGVITDVLDMSKIESGQLEFYPREMNLFALVEEIKILLETQAEEKGIVFQVDCAGLNKPLVLGDALRVKQVLTNLLGNALKFTPEGGHVTLTVSQEEGRETVQTLFTVADTGCGMSQEFLDKIWLPFEQERRIASQSGTGLGTTLSKTLVEKMNGTIEVESREGEGTVFRVAIPFPAVQEQKAAELSAEEENSSWELAGKQVLIVEDNEINRMILGAILEEQGCVLTEAADGAEALSVFEHSSPGFFDLILMDVQMPVMNGYEAARRIRALSRPDAEQVPIFSITANAFREDVEKALEAGMNDVITKPLDVKLLLVKIRNLKEQEDGKR